MLRYKNTSCSWTELNTDSSKIGSWSRDSLGVQFKYLFPFFLGLSVTIPSSPRCVSNIGLKRALHTIPQSKRVWNFIHSPSKQQKRVVEQKSLKFDTKSLKFDTTGAPHIHNGRSWHSKKPSILSLDAKNLDCLKIIGVDSDLGLTLNTTGAP